MPVKIILDCTSNSNNFMMRMWHFTQLMWSFFCLRNMQPGGFCYCLQCGKLPFAFSVGAKHLKQRRHVGKLFSYYFDTLKKLYLGSIAFLLLYKNIRRACWHVHDSSLFWGEEADTHLPLAVMTRIFKKVDGFNRKLDGKIEKKRGRQKILSDWKIPPFLISLWLEFFSSP